MQQPTANPISHNFNLGDTFSPADLREIHNTYNEPNTTLNRRDLEEGKLALVFGGASKFLGQVVKITFTHWHSNRVSIKAADGKQSSVLMDNVMSLTCLQKVLDIIRGNTGKTLCPTPDVPRKNGLPILSLEEVDTLTGAALLAHWKDENISTFFYKTLQLDLRKVGLTDDMLVSRPWLRAFCKVFGYIFPEFWELPLARPKYAIISTSGRQEFTSLDNARQKAAQIARSEHGNNKVHRVYIYEIAGYAENRIVERQEVTTRTVLEDIMTFKHIN